jgi:8-oxo-dGTP pyrophosphatase MutT (NUDIX family)
LYCIVSEGLAGVSLQIGKLVSAAVKDQPFNLKALVERLKELEAFVGAVLLGTNTVSMPGLTLRDYGWESEGVEVGTDDEEGEDCAMEEEELTVDEPEPVPGPHLHPRPDEQGKPVKITHPSTPTKLAAWHDPSQTATVIPDGPIPTKINGMPFLSWAKAPTTDLQWKSVPGQMLDLVEPAFHVGAGKHPAAGVVIEEADGRVWIVHPTNGYGGYSATFPKGRADALGSHLQAVAIREVHEEAGLQVEITGYLMDVERTTSVCRYYRARRVGGSPADCGWESQAVSLVPKAKLYDVLSNEVDHPLAKLIGAG